MNRYMKTTLVLIPALLAVIAAVALAAGANPSFTFTTDEPGATWQCSLDGAPATSCSSPQNYTNLPAGLHKVDLTGSFTIPTTSQCPTVPGSTATFGPNGYSREGWDTFTKSQASGPGWTNGNDVTPVYTGDQGMGWTTYPDGWGANGVTPAYQPSTVMSVHDGMMDFSLHNDLGSSPSPLPGGNRNQTYGAWSLCEKVTPDAGSNLNDFKQAILLWPVADSNGPAAESDYPEDNFGVAPNAGIPSAFAHFGSGSQDSFPITTPGFDQSQWHVYTQTWGPGTRSYYVDGTLVGTSTSQVWAQPERWQLQVQPLAGHTGGGGHGHVYVGWVWIGTPGGSSSSSSSSTTTSTTTTTTPTTSTTTSSTTTAAGPIQHIILVSMENQDYTNIYPAQPFETSFANAGGLATHYYGTGHFSLDNYITATSGLIGVGNNDSCLSSSANNIFNQLGAGQAVNYEESGAACRHEPAAQYSDLGSSYQAPLPSPIVSFPAKLTWITPTDGHNGHDNGPGGADSYLSGLIPKIEATSQYQAGNTAVVIWYDESNVNDTQGNTTPPNNHVYFAVSVKGVAASQDATTYTHCSLLATVEDEFGVPRLGCAVGAASMVGHFGF